MGQQNWQQGTAGSEGSHEDRGPRSAIEPGDYMTPQGAKLRGSGFGRARGVWVISLALVSVGATLPLQSQTAAATPLGPYGSAVVADSPSVYYRLDEATGPTAADSSGHSLSGLYQANVTYGVPGAIQTEATNSAVTGTSSGVLTDSGPGLPSGNAARTYELWMKSTTAEGSNDQLLSHGGDFSLQMHIASGTQRVTVFGNVTGPWSWEYTLPYPLNDGVWHMLAVSWDSSNLSLYLDGQIVATIHPSRSFSTPGSSGLSLGGYPGSYDELAVYPGALSPHRIDAHWTAGGSKGAACAPTPTGAYPQSVLADAPSVYLGLKDINQDSSDTVAYDRSGQCANGAYQPGATASP